jgi:hypothetical protein
MRCKFTAREINNTSTFLCALDLPSQLKRISDRWYASVKQDLNVNGVNTSLL